ncbi:MAG: class I SAM-dependent methyltransferase [Ardenticatenaceae bacterium]|nr:class I SAM-dependent methyltransferase [Ardenticatenaceae bacterium]
MTHESHITPLRCNYEGSHYQEAFWTTARRYEDLAERAALRKLLPPVGRRIVEIGAGAGRLADLYGQHEEVYLVDYARSQLDQARERWGADPRFTFVQADIYNLPFPDCYFDTVVTVRVLHHIKALGPAFDSIRRILRPGGIYVAEFANKRNLKAVIRYCLGCVKPGENPFGLDPYEFVPLNIDYHPAHLVWELRQAGFDVAQELAVSFFRLGWLKEHLSATLLARLDSSLQAPLARLRLTPSIFLRAEACPLADVPVDSSARWRCPACHSTGIEMRPDTLICLSCGSVYRIIEGVVCMRCDEGFT